MNEYVTILHEVPSDPSRLSPEQIQEMIERYMTWTSELREQGRIVDERSLSAAGARVIRKSGDETVVSDGPYSEAREVVGGLHIIRAESLTDALDWARKCPALDFGAAVEVRQIQEWEV